MQYEIKQQSVANECAMLAMIQVMCRDYAFVLYDATVYMIAHHDLLLIADYVVELRG